MKLTSTHLYRYAGASAIVAGLIFAGIQPIHPPDILSSVTTDKWAFIISLKLAMCFLFLTAITGIYIKQAAKAGWLGLTGFILFGLSWALQSGYVFAELFMLPQLASISPQFVESCLSVANGTPASMNIGALAPVYIVVCFFYLAGGILFGIATYRARIFPRFPAILLAVTALLTPAAALLPHHIQRYAAIPMGISITWLGYILTTKKSNDE
ncbi:MAG: hypothetical protein JWQ30_1864 [Sediminibacterium sp.]|nr:hypothetical protein [Sediminibacterium sp.]